MKLKFTHSPAIVISLLGIAVISGCSKSKVTPVTTTAPTNNGTVITLAGNGNHASVNGQDTSASFYFPTSVALDASRNIYVADAGNNEIRKITPTGLVSTFAGNTQYGNSDGTGTAASFHYPYAIAADASGNLYVADQGNNLIRKITPAGVVTTLAGSGSVGLVNGTGNGASFFDPSGIAVDGSGNVYVSDQGNNVIRKITAAGVVTTFAGSGSIGSANGTGTAATFDFPAGLATDAAGNVYVADEFNNQIRKITPAGVVSTLAGNGAAALVNSGTASSASFNNPTGVTVDANGNVYVADNSNNVIREIATAGVVTTYAGTGSAGAANGVFDTSTFNGPTGLVIDGSFNIYVADNNNHLIRKLKP